MGKQDVETIHNKTQHTQKIPRNLKHLKNISQEEDILHSAPLIISLSKEAVRGALMHRKPASTSLFLP
jgi:hypothetical protein